MFDKWLTNLSCTTTLASRFLSLVWTKSFMHYKAATEV
jgi:hypothetical protein